MCGMPCAAWCRWQRSVKRQITGKNPRARGAKEGSPGCRKNNAHEGHENENTSHVQQPAGRIGRAFPVIYPVSCGGGCTGASRGKRQRAGGCRGSKDVSPAQGRAYGGPRFGWAYRGGTEIIWGAPFGGGIVPGWQEALQLMVEGDIWEVVIPPGLAYGAQGVGTSIGPNETLIFEIELIMVK